MANSINRTNGEQTSNRWLQSIRAINNQLKCPIEILIRKRQQRVLRIGTAIYGFSTCSVSLDSNRPAEPLGQVAH